MGYQYITYSYYYGNGDYLTGYGYVNNGQYKTNDEIKGSSVTNTGKTGKFVITGVSNYSGSTTSSYYTSSYYDSQAYTTVYDYGYASSTTLSGVKLSTYGYNGSWSYGYLTSAATTTKEFDYYQPYGSYDNDYEDGNAYNENTQEVAEDEETSSLKSYLSGLTGMDSDQIWMGTTKADQKEIKKKEDWVLFGDEGNDTLKGGAGDDWLIGAQGTDSLTGGRGDDYFVLDEVGSTNMDTIRDFNAKDDTLVIDKDIVDLSNDDTIEVLTYAEFTNDKYVKSKSIDEVIIMDDAANIKKLNDKGSIDVYLVIDKATKGIFYDEDGVWSGFAATSSTWKSKQLGKFTGKFPTRLSGDNFLFGYEGV